MKDKIILFICLSFSSATTVAQDRALNNHGHNAIRRQLQSAVNKSKVIPAIYKIRIFSASWCEPCQRLHDAIEKINSQIPVILYGEKISLSVEFVDVGEDSSEVRRRMGALKDFFPEIQIVREIVKINPIVLQSRAGLNFNDVNSDILSIAKMAETNIQDDFLETMLRYAPSSEL